VRCDGGGPQTGRVARWRASGGQLAGRSAAVVAVFTAANVRAVSEEWRLGFVRPRAEVNAAVGDVGLAENGDHAAAIAAFERALAKLDADTTIPAEHNAA